MWTIPGVRMKAGVEHSVPLSAAAIGASFTGVTVMLTVATFEVAPLLSLIVYWNESLVVSDPSWV